MVRHGVRSPRGIGGERDQGGGEAGQDRLDGAVAVGCGGDGVGAQNLRSTGRIQDWDFTVRRASILRTAQISIQIFAQSSFKQACMIIILLS